MSDKTEEAKTRDQYPDVTWRRSGLPGPNGNSAVITQLPPEISESTLPVTEIQADKTAQHEEEQVKDAPNLQTGRSKRRILVPVVGVVVLIGAIFGVRYWLHARQYESTDDAFIEGHATQISPKVSGYVQRIYINDNEVVKAGDLLVEIDPRDYEARLAQARATLSAAIARSRAAAAGLALTRVTTGAAVEQASAGVEAARSGVSQARAAASAAEGRLKQSSAAIGAAEANVAQAQAQVAAAEAEAVRARDDMKRYQPLFDQGAISRQQLDWAVAAAATADAQLEAARKRVAAAEAQVGEARAAEQAAADQYTQSLSQITGTQAQVGQASGKLNETKSAPQQVAVRQSELETMTAEIDQAQAAVRQAELDLSYTKIYAPEDGRITKKSVELGALCNRVRRSSRWSPPRCE